MACRRPRRSRKQEELLLVVTACFRMDALVTIALLWGRPWETTDRGPPPIRQGFHHATRYVCANTRTL